jgi:hypothetical protein
MVAPMFTIGDSVAMSFDALRRLRIMVPEQYLPLAAWLHTDVQPNLASLDQLVGMLQRCRQEERTLIGNGCTVDFINDLVLLENRFGIWPRQVVPQDVFWPVLRGMRAFLVDMARSFGLARPVNYPPSVRATIPQQLEDVRKPVFVTLTYFPPNWSTRQVQEAGAGAWASPELIADQTTGAWSGVWRDMEVAGDYNVATGEALNVFPVIAP